MPQESCIIRVSSSNLVAENFVNVSSGIAAREACGAVWLAVHGKGCFLNSPAVENYMDQQLLKGARRFVVDLDDCAGLDSTFMGMLMGMARKLKLITQGCLQIINAHGRNAQLLRGLGVHYFCDVTEDSGPYSASETQAPAESIEVQALTKSEQTEHCLNSHLNLADSHEENREKFASVIDCLQKKKAALESGH